MNKSDCLICKGKIIYLDKYKEMECYFCKNTYESNAMCQNHHYICDSCHSKGAYDIITEYCLKTDDINPLQIAIDIMKHPSFNMHGPEHHYLVPAVLSTAYINKFNYISKKEVQSKKESVLKECRNRSQNVLGGFCGFYGACGAGIGCGIYLSTILDITPLSTEKWGKANLITSKALQNISGYGGPRCCKRDTYTAIQTAIDFTKDYLKIELESTYGFKCEFNNLNRECLKNNCKFYK